MRLQFSLAPSRFLYQSLPMNGSDAFHRVPNFSLE